MACSTLASFTVIVQTRLPGRHSWTNRRANALTSEMCRRRPMTRRHRRSCQHRRSAHRASGILSPRRAWGTVSSIPVSTRPGRCRARYWREVSLSTAHVDHGELPTVAGNARSVSSEEPDIGMLEPAPVLVLVVVVVAIVFDSSLRLQYAETVGATLAPMQDRLRDRILVRGVIWTSRAVSPDQPAELDVRESAGPGSGGLWASPRVAARAVE